MKPIALVLLAMLAAGLYWMMSGGTPDAADALTLEPEVQRQDLVEQTDPAVAPEVAAPEMTPSVTERSVVLTQHEALVEQDLATPPLAGKVVLSEPSGVQSTNLNGTLEVLCWTADDTHTRTIEVQAGQFELDMTDLESIVIEEIRLAGRSAMLSPPEQEFELDQGALEVLVSWAPMVRLSVVSAETSEHLSEIRLVRGSGWMSEAKKHPGPVEQANVALSNGISPLDLEANTAQATSSSTTYYVHSPGYAWQSVSINYASGGERELRLVPGGALSIQLIGKLPRAAANLCLWGLPSRSKEPDAAFGATTREPVEIEDLPPGSYRLRVQQGEWYNNPIVYAELDVEVTTGVRGEHEMMLEAQEEVPLTKLAGTLVIPEAWNFSTFNMHAKFNGTPPNGGSGFLNLKQKDMKQKSGGTNTWLFDFGDRTTGDYKFLFRGTLPDGSGSQYGTMEYAIKMRALPGEASNMRIEIPEPANVNVKLLDALSGESTNIGSIHWGSLVPPATRASILNTVPCGVESNTFKFRAPVGTITLGSFGGDFNSLEEDVQIQAGNNEFTFHLRRNCPLVILFLDGESTVPVDDFWVPSPKHLDGNGQLVFTSMGQTGFTTALSEPGRYVFPMPEFDGFEPTPEQTITVVSGEETTHTVQLVREK